MKSVEEVKKILRENKDYIREKYGVVIIGIFGSFARGEQKEASDIDILVELERPIGLEYFALWDYLEKILDCKVDLVKKSLLREELRDGILEETIVL
ncbi:MAG: nucleotidyltransferase family protein [Thermodesulfovibrio sp.]|nr:nucleotidyltransferase family protein [Thermodesulfovibrio sp.]